MSTWYVSRVSTAWNPIFNSAGKHKFGFKSTPDYGEVERPDVTRADNISY